MKHGLAKSSTYSSWSNMVQRCNNIKNTHYSRYGGRGIAISEQWLNFSNFLEDMGEKPTILHTLDRVNNNGNYEKGNCRWATRREQAYNRSTNVFHEIDGVIKTTTEWLNHFGIKQSTFDQRVYVYHWPVRKALTTTVEKRG